MFNIFSSKDKKFKRITLIVNPEVTTDMQLFWKNTPVSFETNNLTDIRKLVESKKLYFMVDKIVCHNEKVDIGIICINANQKYEFELIQPDEGSEKLKIVQIIDDFLLIK